MITVKEEVIRARSVRAFDESYPVSIAALDEILDCARLCPSAGNNQPLKYKVLDTKEDTAKAVSLTKWAAKLPQLELPPKGNYPCAFIIIMHDTAICPITNISQINVGIVAQTINLAAREKGYGSCMLASFNQAEIKDAFNLPINTVPVLMIALGAPAEKEAIVSTAFSPNGTDYFRGPDGVHYVPKRSLEEIVVK